MKNTLFIVFALLLVLAQSAHAWMGYNYVSAEDMKGWLESKKPLLIVDIQEKQNFAAHHIKGSTETNAYPVKSDKDRQTIDPSVKLYQSNHYEAVVVVCPRGKGGAKRAYDYLKKQGVEEEKLFILTGGMDSWPYREWVESK